MHVDNATIFDATALPLIGPKGEPVLTVIVKGTFLFASGHTEPADDQIPIRYGDEFEDEARGAVVRYESDLVPFKPRADIVLRATAYAPGGKPAPAVPVALRVGALEKRLAVFGERYWNHAGVLSRRYTMTPPKPFVQRPIIYRDAFGGMDAVTGEYCPENLVGTGLYSNKAKQNLAGKPLPCIEDPRCLIREVDDRPRPAGFGFYHRAWRPRAAYAGTYDEAWRRQRSPLPPEDFDARFYNGAHPDLQAEGYLKGGEAVVLLNLLPEGQIGFHLAEVTPRCTIRRRTDNGRPKHETPALHLDTLFMEPDQKRYCLVWRAAIPWGEASADGLDAIHITVAQDSK